MFFEFFGVFFGFMRVDAAKTARVTRMRLMPKLQSAFFGYFFGFAVMGHADRAIERTLSRMTQSRPVPWGSEGLRWFRALRQSGFGALSL